MQHRFVKHYPAARQSLIVSNANHVEPVKSAPRCNYDCFRLGHLSNLGPQKGLEEVLDTARRLIASGIPVRLILAGPAASQKDAEVLSVAKSELGDALEYLGPVYGDDKKHFYDQIDVFLLPTRGEAQPNVLFEAMAAAVPCISYARGCVAYDLAGSGGMAVPVDKDFVEAALPTLKRWQSNSRIHIEAREKSLERVRNLKRAADKQFYDFISAVAGTKENDVKTRSWVKATS